MPMRSVLTRVFEDRDARRAQDRADAANSRRAITGAVSKRDERDARLRLYPRPRNCEQVFEKREF